jgi:hypothetical protein
MMNWSNDAGTNMSEPQTTDKSRLTGQRLASVALPWAGLSLNLRTDVKEPGTTDLLQDDEVVL